MGLWSYAFWSLVGACKDMCNILSSKRAWTENMETPSSGITCRTSGLISSLTQNFRPNPGLINPKTEIFQICSPSSIKRLSLKWWIGIDFGLILPTSTPKTHPLPAIPWPVHRSIFQRLPWPRSRPCETAWAWPGLVVDAFSPTLGWFLRNKSIANFFTQDGVVGSTSLKAYAHKL